MNDSLGRRALAGAAFVLLVIGAAYLGGLVFLFFALAVVALALREFFNLVRVAGYAPYRNLGTVLGLALPSCAFLFGSQALAAASAGVLLACLIATFARPGGRSVADSAVTALGVYYVGFLASHMVLLRESPSAAGLDYDEGFAVVMAAFAATWCSDTGAYLLGRALGRHKLWPEVSPGKTWEGAVAGLAGAVGGLALVRRLLGGPFGWPEMVPLGIALGAIGLAGDLIESALKRSVGWKDTGAIMPGHGGALDRFDSFLFVAPAVYYYLIASGYVTGF
jgi:phosphatidate cytidylyltransferase